jgi:hypothetical protein
MRDALRKSKHNNEAGKLIHCFSCNNRTRAEKLSFLLDLILPCWRPKDFVAFATSIEPGQSAIAYSLTLTRPYTVGSFFHIVTYSSHPKTCELLPKSKTGQFFLYTKVHYK